MLIKICKEKIPKHISNKRILTCKLCGRNFDDPRKNGGLTPSLCKHCHPLYKCSHCGKEFAPKNWNLQTVFNEIHFCCQNCSSQYMWDHTTKEQAEKRMKGIRDGQKKWFAEMSEKDRSDFCMANAHGMTLDEWKGLDENKKLTIQSKHSTHVQLRRHKNMTQEEESELARKRVNYLWEKLDTADKRNKHLENAHNVTKKLWETDSNFRQRCLFGLTYGSTILKEINGDMCISLNGESFILWEEYKNLFIQKIQNISNLIPFGFKQIPTFRSQNSVDWKNARKIFEQSLIDMNVKWFCYIKYFIDNVGNIKPLVVGKSGSKLVNSNGSDVNFSTDINDGPARLFLYETGFQWCKEFISIKSFDDEKDALMEENRIQKEYCLFGS